LPPSRTPSRRPEFSTSDVQAAFDRLVVDCPGQDLVDLPAVHGVESRNGGCEDLGDHRDDGVLRLAVGERAGCSVRRAHHAFVGVDPGEDVLAVGHPPAGELQGHGVRDRIWDRLNALNQSSRGCLWEREWSEPGALSDRIITRQHRRIYSEVNESRGASFTFELPLARD
jgi:hypothetical protein